MAQRRKLPTIGISVESPQSYFARVEYHAALLDSLRKAGLGRMSIEELCHWLESQPEYQHYFRENLPMQELLQSERERGVHLPEAEELFWTLQGKRNPNQNQQMLRYLRSNPYVTAYEFKRSAGRKQCTMCTQFDGKVFPKDDDEHVPPLHDGCECYILPYVDLSDVHL
jgi:hypothetical protein